MQCLASTRNNTANAIVHAATNYVVPEIYLLSKNHNEILQDHIVDKQTLKFDVLLFPSNNYAHKGL